MADVQLIDFPDGLVISDEELAIGKTVRSWTWVNAAHLINYLNFHARKTLPYTRWHTNITRCEFVYPVDGPNYLQRWLTVVVGVTGRGDGSGLADVSVKTSTSGVTWYTLTAAFGAAGVGVFQSSEETTTYLVFRVPITGDARELVTIDTGGGVRLDGFGAWELPPRAGGVDVAESGGGLLPSVAAIDDSVSSALLASDYFPAADVDLDIGALQTSLDLAWLNNRRIIWSGGCADQLGSAHAWELNCGGVAGSWVSVPEGGIFVPSYVRRPSDTYRTIRAACCYKVASGSALWRLKTSRGSFPVGGQALASTSLEWSAFGSPFSPSANGIQAEVGNAGEWVELELWQDNAARNPRLYQVIVWEDGPQ